MSTVSLVSIASTFFGMYQVSPNIEMHTMADLEDTYCQHNNSMTSSDSRPLLTI